MHKIICGQSFTADLTPKLRNVWKWEPLRSERGGRRSVHQHSFYGIITVLTTVCVCVAHSSQHFTVASNGDDLS